jgi:hypothetical protein
MILERVRYERGQSVITGRETGCDRSPIKKERGNTENIEREETRK